MYIEHTKLLNRVIERRSMAITLRNNRKIIPSAHGSFHGSDLRPIRENVLIGKLSTEMDATIRDKSDIFAKCHS